VATVTPDGSAPRQVDVRFERVPGWIERYDARHPGTTWAFTSDRVVASSADGSSATISIPFPPLGQPDLAGLRAHLGRPWRIGIILVRRGGFAVARLEGAVVSARKTGQRHVQGRTKAGGWSQQRFARRRANQAQAAFDAASGYVHELLLPHADDLDQLVTGGDREAIDAVFSIRALTPLLSLQQRWIPGLPDPKPAVLDRAIGAARSVTVAVTDTTHKNPAPPSR
jgi:hypothetical protein